MSDDFAALLAGWPGRFRHGRLLVTLAAGEGDHTAALIDGIASDLDEHQVFEHLVAEGRFAVALEMLERCQAFEDTERHQLRLRCETTRDHRLDELAGRLRRLIDTAEQAGLTCSVERAELEARCSDDWPSVAGELSRLERDLAEQISQRREAFGERVGDVEEQWAAAFRSLLDKGQLRAAEGLLNRPDELPPGPAVVPPLPSWQWQETPEQVLAMHLDPSRGWPASRRAIWGSAEGDARHRLVDAYDSLRFGGSGAAVEFATALDAFLTGGEPAGKKADPVEGGHLTTLSGVFADPAVAQFGQTGTVELFVGEPGTRQVPARLMTLPPFVAVLSETGDRPYSDRGNAALLDLRSLLRLVTATTRPSVALLRLLGPQWPLTGFTWVLTRQPAGEDLGRLAWIMDLAGLGDLAATAQLVYETGSEPTLVSIFLELLARSRRAPHEPLPRWAEDGQVVAAIRAAVLAPLGGSAGAEAALWAALATGRPGEAVPEDELLFNAALFAQEPPSDAEDRLLREGVGSLSRLPLAEPAAPGEVCLRECGVLNYFSGRADAELADAMAKLAQAASAGPRPAEAGPWKRHRNALAPDTADLTGSADLAEVLDEMVTDFEGTYADIDLTVEVPRPAPVSVRSELLQVVLYELLSNAAEALEGLAGSVRIQARLFDGDLVVDVQDTGPGAANPRRIFRKGYSTRGEGRGDGLFRARTLTQQVEGELALEPAAHPVYTGAHLRLTLPSRP